MRLKYKDLNYINLALSALIVLAIIYIGLSLNQSQSKASVPLHSETRLSINIKNGLNNSSLSSDVTSIKSSINVENQDQKLAQADLAFMANEPKVIINRANILSYMLKNVQQAESQLMAINQFPSNQLYDLANLIKNDKNKLTQAGSLLASNKVSVVNQLSKTISSLNQSLSLILPRIGLIKLANDQIVNEIKLTKLAAKLPAVIIAAGSQGVTMTDFYADLTTLQSDISLAKPISISLGSALIGHQSSIQSLKQKAQSRLVAADSDMKAALNAANTIVVGLVGS